MARSSDPDNGWIPQAEYDLIQKRVPILCVDLLPLDRGTHQGVGLIRRETYDGNEGWCMIGGAVKRNEGLLSALGRHVRSTLGDRVEYELASTEPQFVAEYFTEPGIGELHDPRKHAIALTYAAVCEGSPLACGEALEFRWFDRTELDSVEFGFGQGAVVRRVLDRIER
jgi:ADP-ribose pyrophosphatase YjhB (NUDIX family)